MAAVPGMVPKTKVNSRTYPAPGGQDAGSRHHKDPGSEYAGGDGQRPQGHPDWGLPLPKGQKQPSGQSGRIRQKEDGTKVNSQPGTAAPGSGGGRDTPGAGKERGQFEKDRQGRMQGSGGQRPPIYTPPPHKPGGYQTVNPAPKKVGYVPGQGVPGMMLGVH